MAHIEWLSEEEPYCADCGAIGVISCYCAECSKCGEFRKDTEEREDVVESPFLCEECYNELLDEDLYCEECERYADEIIELNNGSCICNECNRDRLMPQVNRTLK